jgi:Ferritin-like domain
VGEVHPLPSESGRAVDRRRLLTGGATITGAAALAVLWRRTTTDVATAQTDTTLDLMNLALTTEFLLCSAYEEAHGYEVLEDADRELIGAMLAAAEQHVAVFTAAVERTGGQPIERPGFTFPEEAQASREACLLALLELENTTLRGWYGAIPIVQEPAVLELARPMILAKARHAGAIAHACGGDANPFPEAIDTGIPLPDALQTLERYRGMDT